MGKKNLVYPFLYSFFLDIKIFNEEKGALRGGLYSLYMYLLLNSFDLIDEIILN